MRNDYRKSIKQNYIKPHLRFVVFAFDDIITESKECMQKECTGNWKLEDCLSVYSGEPPSTDIDTSDYISD